MIFHVKIFFFLQFVFEGVLGLGYKGDMALDDISMNDGPCPPSSKSTINSLHSLLPLICHIVEF